MPISLGYSKSARQIWKMSRVVPKMLHWSNGIRRRLMEWARKRAYSVPPGWKRAVAWAVFGGVSVGTIGMLYYLVLMAAALVYVFSAGLIVCVWMFLTAWYMLIITLVVALVRGPRVYGGVQRQW